MKLPYTLRIRPQQKIFVDGKHHSWDSTIDVLDASGSRIEKFFLMAAAMDDDIQNPEGSGATALEEIRRIEAGEVDTISSDGNGWVAHITRDKVWFESLYSQGEGGEVTFAQYKLAVQTYVRFLADPEQKPIEVPFPVD
jgi:hypothetical protein